MNNTSTFDSDSFLREHLPQVRATDEFETSVLALTALNRLPEVVLPESFEEIIIRQGRQMRRMRVILYSALGLGLVGTVAYFLYVQSQPVQIAVNYEVPTVPSLVIPSEVTPPAQATPIDPVIMKKVEAQIKKPAQPVQTTRGVAGY